MVGRQMSEDTDLPAPDDSAGRNREARLGLDRILPQKSERNSEPATGNRDKNLTQSPPSHLSVKRVSVAKSGSRVGSGTSRPTILVAILAQLHPDSTIRYG